MTMNKRSMYNVALAVLLLGLVAVTPGVWLPSSSAHDAPDQASTTTTSSTMVSTPGSITFTSPSSGASFTGTQTYTISGTISPAPSLPDRVSIGVELLGSSSLVDSATRTVTASGTFSYSTHVGGTSSWVTGTYVVVATDSSGATGYATFQYTAPAVTTTSMTSTSTTSTSTTTSSSTTTSTVGSITFTSPSSGASLSGTQSYTISGTISPTPSLPDSVSIHVTLLGYSSSIDSSTQATTSSGTFSYSTHVGGTSSWVTGTYVVVATDSFGASGYMTFQYTAPAVTTTSTTSSVTTTATTTTSSVTTTATTTTTSSNIAQSVTTTTTSTTTKTAPGPTTTVPGPTSTVTSTSTVPPSTITSTQTVTQTATSTSTTSAIPDWAYGAMVVLLLVGLATGYVVKRSSTQKG